MEITGRVTADAVVSTTKSDKQVVNFNIAINDRYQTKSGEKRDVTEFVRCSYWIGSGVARVLTKGTLVQISGRISAQAWQGSDGASKASLQFHTSNIKILGGGKGEWQKRLHKPLTEQYQRKTKTTTCLSKNLQFFS